MFCGKCGTKLPDNAKFCGVCGAKVLTKPTNNDSNNLKNSENNAAQSQKSPSTDKDIFDQIEENSRKKSKAKTTVKNKDKTKKSIKIDFKSIFKLKPKENTKPKPKVKAKLKLKPKAKPKIKVKPKKQNNFKNSNKKSIKLILIIAIIFVVAIAVGVVIFILAFGDKIFANKYVGSAVTNTYKYVENKNETYNNIPNLIFKSYKEDKYTDSESSLSIKDAKGGLISEDVLGNLKGISIKSDIQTDSEKNISLTKLTLSNKDKDDIVGEVYTTPEIAVFDIPRLYDKMFGINLVQEEAVEGEEGEEGKAEVKVNSPYYTTLKDHAEVISQFKNSKIDAEKSLKLSSENLVKSILVNSKFNLESKDKDTNERVYKTTISSKVCLDSLKTYLTDLKTDENIVKIASYIMSTYSNTSLEQTKDTIASKIDGYISAIDNAVKENSVNDIVFTLRVNANKVIEHAELGTVISGLGVDVSIDISDDEGKEGSKLNAKLSNEEQKSYISLDLNTVYDNSIENKYCTKTSIVFDNSLEEKIYADISTEYDNSQSNYSYDLDFHTDTSSENFGCKFSIDGIYESSDDVERFNISSMKLDFNTTLYRFYFELEGFIYNKKIESIEEKNIDNIVYVDKMSDDEIKTMKSIMSINVNEFIDMFEKYEW